MSEYGGAEASIVKSETATAAANTYYFGEKGIGLYVNAKGMGTYTLAFALKSTAINNYELENAQSEVTYRYFFITAKDVTLTASIVGWTYGDTPNAPIAQLNGTPATADIVYAYVRVANTDGVLSYLGKLISQDAVNILKGDNTYVSSLGNMPDAGYYILMAHYNGGKSVDGEVIPAATVYYVF